MFAIYSSLLAPPPPLLKVAEDQALAGQDDGFVFEVNTPTSAVIPVP
jgi:hypothetical protein